MAAPESEYSSDITWNASKPYSEGVVLSMILRCNTYVRLAYTGSEEDQMAAGIIIPMPIELAKIEGIDKLINELRLIIETTYFKLSQPNKTKVKNYDTTLMEHKQTLRNILIQKKDGVTGTISYELNNTLFEITIEELREINREIKIPVYEAGFLYQVSKQKTKKEIMDLFKED